MRGLTSNDFSLFFESVHNEPDTPEDERKRPFDWQKRLAQQVLNGKGWRDVIRVPTGCGKTSALDIAIFELALQAGRWPDERTAARRICFVIDRRLVVDEVAAHAGEIQRALLSAAQGNRDEPVLQGVAGQFALLAADPKKPLRVVRLRGGVYRDDGWAADPLTPTILVSTVDQIGSRLLFRGYGVSPRSRPVHAGLLAFDTRIILDEAHLSAVFVETLERIREYQNQAEQSPLPASRCVSIVCMSATAGAGAKPPFKLTGTERQDARLKPRLEASKPAKLIEVKVEAVTQTMRREQPGKARKLEQTNRKVLVKELVAQAKQLGGLSGTAAASQDNLPRVVGVVVNRVATARQVFEQLCARGQHDPECDAILLTGRIRAYDRDRLLKDYLPKIKAGREHEPGCPLFVVATQTVEVGANLDFDVLVSEAAPLDALRQRFGRLYRIPDKPARRAACSAAILVRSDQKSKSEADPIYGQAIAETWKWLKKNAAKKKGQQPSIDFGVNLLDPKLPAAIDDLRPMLAPQPDAPLLLPAYLDAWVQTEPLPEPDPDVAPFLHGPVHASADVQVVWRSDVTEENTKDWRKIVSLMPPQTREALPVPIYEARAWLRRQAEGDVADIEGLGAEEQPGRQDRGRRGLRWRDSYDAEVVGPDDLRPGDTIIVPATYGGADEFGWNPESTGQVRDVAEPCLAQLIASYPQDAFRRPKLRLRLHPSLLPDADEQTRNRLRTMVGTATAAARAEGQDPWPAVKRLLQAMRDHIDDPAHRAAIDALQRLTRSPQIELYPNHDGLAVVSAVSISLPDEQQEPGEELEYQEPHDDDTSIAVSGREVSLVEHTEGVEHQVAAFAGKCGLNQELADALKLAAHWHDQGKRDRRFQAWLQGSELKALTALVADQPLAKSGRPLGQWGRPEAFGYPQGERHEFVSVRLFEQAVEALNDVGELVKLLIGTHHGHGRAFVPVTKDPNPIEVALNHAGKRIAVPSDHRLYRLDSGWVDLFWRMVRRHGWWGLAYLEALLITADRLVSSQEQEAANQSKEPVR